MLEITKIKFVEKPDAIRPNCTQVIGGLSMHCEMVVDNNEKIPADFVKEQITERIWRMTYGDLHQPLMELQAYANRTAPPEHQMRVQELCEQLNALLTRKSPNVLREPSGTDGSRLK